MDPFSGAMTQRWRLFHREQGKVWAGLPAGKPTMERGKEGKAIPRIRRLKLHCLPPAPLQRRDLTMNIHHLELFYYVARHGGISRAVRSMPYGIQQPAVSSQISQLEEFLGVILFHRRPFALTPEGEKLFEFVSDFVLQASILT